MITKLSLWIALGLRFFGTLATELEWDDLQTPFKTLEDEQPQVNYNGLAMTPQMGWNNWAAFKCDVNAELLEGTAQRMVELGLRDIGYQYVVLDDCWSMGRDQETGELLASKVKFPKGIKDMAQRLHSMGLLFGMYSSAGRWTCAGYEGSLGYEEIDAKTFAKWEVDYLKYDNCFNEGQYGTPELSFKRYKAMSDALLSSGRKIFYAICNWGEDSPWDWGFTISNSWRISGDLCDRFDKIDVRGELANAECKQDTEHCSFISKVNKAASFSSKSRPGGWDDLDMMEIGNGGSSDEEYKTHFSMWSVLKSSLLMATDIRKLDSKAYSIYSNQAVIAVNQDPLGATANRVWWSCVDDVDDYGRRGEISLWTGPLSGGDQLVALLNTANSTQVINATLQDIFYGYGPEGRRSKIQAQWDIYDLWGNRLDDEIAEQIVSPNTSEEVVRALTLKHLFNTTEKSYAQGLVENDERLLGKNFSTVMPAGTISAKVNAHGVALYRLRQSTRSAAQNDDGKKKLGHTREYERDI